MLLHFSNLDLFTMEDASSKRSRAPRGLEHLSWQGHGKSKMHVLMSDVAAPRLWSSSSYIARRLKT